MDYLNKLPDGVIVDDEDLERVLQHKWHQDSCGYLATDIGSRAKGTYKKIRLHRFIMGPADGLVVDHKNHNKLDNRKSNLRVCTQSENNMNRSMQNNNKSGYTGVCFDKYRNKWVADLRAYGKRYRLGRFKSFDEAVKAHREATLRLKGEWAWFE